MPCRVVYYIDERGENPVEKYLDSLPRKTRDRMIWKIELLKAMGDKLPMPHANRMTGKRERGLFELRELTDGARVLYFFDGDTAILLHGFTKKSNKTPGKIIELALNRREKYKERKP